MHDTSNSSKAKVNQLLEEAYELRVHDLTKSIQVTERALALSKANDLPELTARGLSRLSLYKMIRGEHQQSLAISKEAIKIFKSLDDERGIALAKYSIAGIYYKTNNYHLGMVYLLDCLISFRKFKDYHNESRTLKSLGAIHEFLSDYSNAKLSYESSIKAALKVKDKNLESNAYNPLSGLLLKVGKVDDAYNMIAKSINLKKETNDIRGLAFAIHGRGKVYLAQKKYKEAKQDFLEAARIHDSFGEKLGKSMTSYKLAELCLLENENEEAKNILIATAQTTEKDNGLIINLKCNRLLAKIYRQENDFENSLYYLEKYIKKKETITNSQMLKVIKNYEKAAKIKSSEREARLELEKAEILAKKNIAERSAEVKQEFLSAMSHEIRTPLNAVTSIISLLENRSSPEEQELLTSLRFSSRNLLRIINDILDFSKLDSNKMYLSKDPVVLKKFIENIELTYLNMAREKGLNFKLHISSKLHVAYKFDETKLFQILGNLLSNAVKYTKEGKVELFVNLVTTTNTHDTLKFEVKDTGIGIAKNDIENLFESFYMPNSVTTRDFGGTGLGLAIVKKLVQLYGSEIKVISEEGKGSSFYFELLLERAKENKKKTKDITGVLQSKKAILAEDNEVNAIVMEKLLARIGVSIIRAKDGEEALTIANSNKVDFILMDIHMPKMNGFEAAREIKKATCLNNKTPMFALTADITIEGKDDYEIIFDGFLSKPIQIDRLFVTLVNALEKID